MKKALAQTYQFNILASALGRFAAKDVDEETVQQVSLLLEQTLNTMNDETPPVPHTNPELLRQALIFDKKLTAMIEYASKSSLVSKELAGKLHSIISKHSKYCNSILLADGAFEMLVDPASIAKEYGLPSLWEDAEDIIFEEVNNWGKSTQHPIVPSSLAKKVDAKTTKKLIQLAHNDLFHMPEELNVDVVIENNVKLYHLFWLPAARSIRYVTPSSYDIATQLSFDIPHNVAHLNHLSALDKQRGVLRYNDSMAQRGYFEAVAVLSEFVIVKVLQKNSDIGSKILNTLGVNQKIMTVEKLNDWIIQDRSFEFKLRVARFYADLLMIQGYDFQETVSKISEKLGISIEQAASETRKYLPWTGLGAVYTYGYRELLTSGVNGIKEAIYAPNNSVIESWQQFRAIDR